jgi:ubiquinone/menaquinone biosynthesis C-methylase UbiE
MSATPQSVPQDPWEAAYSRFETPEREISKFMARLRHAGADNWPKESAVVELFCGRGNGLQALARIGFRNIQGVDLSPRLLQQCTGTAKTIVADCRQLPFADHSQDIAIVQGGLHHLPTLPDDLDQCLREIRRVLRPNGRAMFVEPWNTPFLRIVHAFCNNFLARKCSAKLDALATMIDHERITYEQWLTRPHAILCIVDKYFVLEQQSFAWGKWNFLGQPRS